MPIAVRVVKESDFSAWVEGAKKKYAGVESVPPNTLAAATSLSATTGPAVTTALPRQ